LNVKNPKKVRSASAMRTSAPDRLRERHDAGFGRQRRELPEGWRPARTNASASRAQVENGTARTLKGNEAQGGQGVECWQRQGNVTDSTAEQSLEGEIQRESEGSNTREATVTVT
jgi:hypothetical protein